MSQNIMECGEFAQNVEVIGLNPDLPYSQSKLLYQNETPTLMTESLAEVFFQIANTQRLDIMLNLNDQEYKMSEMAKKLDATMPHVHRDFNKLQDSNLIEKNPDGHYHLTSFGKMMCSIIPMVDFMNKNKKYFDNHSFDDLPNKFVERMSALSNSKMIRGYVKVVEKWKEIYSNADKFISNVLVEASYSEDIVQIITQKVQKNIKIRSIFSNNPIVTKERNTVLKKYDIQKFIEDEKIMRKMSKDLSIVIVLNEKEAGVSFPSDCGSIDMGNMFYSDDPRFYEWCLDYFEHLWKNSSRFQENKVKSE